MDRQSKTVLITGGAGFIGSWLIRVVLRSHPQWKIINLDALTYAGNLDNLRDIENNSGYQFVNGSINDVTLVNKLMKQADYCVHVAAETHVDRSIQNAQIFAETNVLGTQVLLDAAKNSAIEKFVLVSTDEVYGTLDLNSNAKFTEETPLNPTNPYSATKAGADLLALSYYKTHQLPVCITRCGNNYGPNQYPEKLIPFFMLKLMNNEKVPLYGDGLNVRDWIYVEDHAEGILKVLELGQLGEVYNIGGGLCDLGELNNKIITHKLLNAFGKDDSSIQYVTDRLAHDRRYAMDARKIKRELNWEPKVSFEAGLEKTIQWYKSNSDWIQKVIQKQQEQNACLVS